MNKFFYYIIFLLLFIGATVNAQKLNWAVSIPTNPINNSFSIFKIMTQSENGDIILVGTLSGSYDYDTSINYAILNDTVDGSIVIAKYDSNYNFKWAKAFGRLHNLSNPFVKTICVDFSNNIIIGGSFSDTANFNISNNNTLLYSNGAEDAFILKLDSNGNFIWVKQFGGFLGDGVNSICIDKNNNIISVGKYTNTADMDPDINVFLVNSTSAYSSVFVNCLDSSGNFKWANGYSGNNLIESFIINVDSSGNFIFGGRFTNNINLDPNGSNYILTSKHIDTSDFYLCKINNQGNFIWAQQLKKDGQSLYTKIRGIQIDYFNNIFICGDFAGIVYPDPFTSTTIFTTNNNPDYFLSKFDSSGNYIWFKQFGGTNADYSYALKLKNNFLGLTSNFTSTTIDIDPNSNLQLFNNLGNFDGIIAQYDLDGNFICGGATNGLSGQHLYDVEISNSNKITVLGQFLGVSDINPSAAASLITTINNRSIIQLQPNHPASALPDSATLTCSADSIIIPCIANDSDTDECYQLLYFLDSANSIYGTSYIDSFSGNLVYKAKPTNPCNTALVDTVWYKVADRQWLPFISKSFAVIHLNACACPNHAPSANPDSIITTCNTTTTIYPKINDTDIDTGQLISITNLITTGLQGSATYTDSTITFTPNTGFSGTTSLQYIICDNGSPSLCDTTTVTFSVTYCNHAPIAAADSVSFYCLDSLLIHPLGNDADADTFQQIHISALLIAGLQGTAMYTDTSITFYPNTNFTGIATLQYIVCDNDTASLCDTATVAYFVAACNHAPIAVNDVVNIACQDSIWLQPLSNDSDADSNQTISITNIYTYPSKGTILKNGNAILYKALACKSGLDSFSYIICDNHTDAKCDTAVVYIQIATCGCEPPVANFSVNLDTICTGKCVQVQDLSTNFTNAWSWTCIGANPSTSSLANPIFCFGNAGQYNITLIAANNFGSDTISFVNAVTVVPSPTISISHDTNVAAGSSIALQCSGAVNYAWWPITGLSNPNGSSTMASIQQPISYLCTASDANNCTASAAVNIGIISQLVIPNAFSPNGDGINDEFAIQLPPHTNFHLRIFNRWGNEIFTSTAIQNKWNGKYKNVDVPMETYFYTLTWVDAKNVEHIENGELTVVR